MELITIAVVRFENFKHPKLYRAPRWELSIGDTVICEHPLVDNEELIGEVERLQDVFLGGDEYNFDCALADIEEPKKILAMIRRKDFTYPTIEEAEQKESEPEESE